MTRLIMFLATGFYTGYLPKAPGTWGTLPAFPLHLLLIQLNAPAYAAMLVLIVIVAFFTAGSAEKIIDRKDPGVIVIDEIAGMLVALIGSPITPAALALAFILFRIFDICKPFPISWVDKRINGGVGIVADDLIAGVFTWITLQIIYRLLPVIT